MARDKKIVDDKAEAAPAEAVYTADDMAETAAINYHDGYDDALDDADFDAAEADEDADIEIAFGSGIFDDGDDFCDDGELIGASVSQLSPAFSSMEVFAVLMALFAFFTAVIALARRGGR